MIGRDAALQADVARNKINLPIADLHRAFAVRFKSKEFRHSREECALPHHSLRNGATFSTRRARELIRTSAQLGVLADLDTYMSARILIVRYLSTYAHLSSCGVLWAMSLRTQMRESESPGCDRDSVA